MFEQYHIHNQSFIKEKGEKMIDILYLAFIGRFTIQNIYSVKCRFFHLMVSRRPFKIAESRFQFSSVIISITSSDTETIESKIFVNSNLYIFFPCIIIITVL